MIDFGAPSHADSKSEEFLERPALAPTIIGISSLVASLIKSSSVTETSVFLAIGRPLYALQENPQLCGRSEGPRLPCLGRQLC